MRPSSLAGEATEVRNPRRQEESDRARRRVLNLLSRHPDLIKGNLEGVANTLCSEASMALACKRVSLWTLVDDKSYERAFSGNVFPDIPMRELDRKDAPAFFAAIERRRILEPGRIHEFEEVSTGSLIAPILVQGHTWGFCSFEGSFDDESWCSSSMDFAVVLTEMIGRCIEQARAHELEARLERSERGIEGLARLLGDALCFEVVEGVLQFQGDPTNIFGTAARGSLFELEALMAKIDLDDREVLERRFGDWHSAGSPGALTARVRYHRGLDDEIQLECRLLRSQAPSGARLWGMVRPA